MNIEIDIKKSHLTYLRYEFGYDGFNKQFRQAKCISYLRWLSRVLQEHKDLAENDLVPLELPEHHLDMLLFSISIVTYKTLCETLNGAASSEYLDAITELSGKLKKLDESNKAVERQDSTSVAHLSRDEFVKMVADEVRVIYQEVLDYGNEVASFRFKPTKVSPKLTFNFKAGQSRSFARGTELVSLSLSPFVDDQPLGKFFYWEYKSIRANKPIGEFETTNWKLPIYALVCHEVAHSFQMAIERQGKQVVPEYAASMAKPHGKGWQELYKIFRDQFVNRELYPDMFSN